MDRALRVFVADDHAVFRQGLRALLDSEPDLKLAGEAATGREAVEGVAGARPDVVLMDIQMPGINGIEATRRILETDPGVGVVVLTMFEDDDSVFAAMRAGARGYILKGADPDEILKVLRAVAEGEAHFGPEIARRLTSFFSAPDPPTRPRPSPSSRRGNARSSTSSPAATTTPRSRGVSFSATRPCATTSHTSSPSCASPTGPRR